MHGLAYQFITVVLISGVLSPVSAQTHKVYLDTEFSLVTGQAITIEGERLVIKFKAVLEDSRCPVNVTCVWTGNGKVFLEILDIDGKSQTVILNTEDEPKEIALKGYKLTLISLNPPRIDGVSLSPSDYVARLSVERASSD